MLGQGGLPLCLSGIDVVVPAKVVIATPPRSRVVTPKKERKNSRSMHTDEQVLQPMRTWRVSVGHSLPHLSSRPQNCNIADVEELGDVTESGEEGTLVFPRVRLHIAQEMAELDHLRNSLRAQDRQRLAEEQSLPFAVAGRLQQGLDLTPDAPTSEDCNKWQTNVRSLGAKAA